MQLFERIMSKQEEYLDMKCTEIYTLWNIAAMHENRTETLSLNRIHKKEYYKDRRNISDSI